MIRLLLSLFLLASCNEEKLTYSLKKGAFQQEVTLTGSVIPKKRSTILAPYDAYIKKLHVRAGDQIKKGDPIATLTQHIGSGGPHYPLRSPFDGVVVQTKVSEGEYIVKGSTEHFIARIDDVSELYIDVDIPEIEMGKVKIGQEAKIKVNALPDYYFAGQVSELALASDEAKSRHRTSSVYTGMILVSKPYKNLKPGMSVILDIISYKNKDAVMIPHEAVTIKKGAYYATTTEGVEIKLQVGKHNRTHLELVGDIDPQTKFLPRNQ